MAMKLKRPVLVGGLGLTAGTYLWTTITPSLPDLGSLLLWGMVAAGSAAWWLGWYRDNAPAIQPQRSHSPVTIQQLNQAFDRATQAIAQFVTEANTSKLSEETIQSTAFQLQATLTAIRDGLGRKTLRFAIAGDAGVGKTSLAQWLQQEFLPSQLAEADQWSIDATDTHSLADITPASDGIRASIPAGFTDADLVMVMVAGDLTDFQYQRIAALAQRNCRMALVFAKADRYLPNERSQILQSLQQRLAEITAAPIDLVATAIAPAPIKVRKHCDDGTVEERLDQPNPDVEALTAVLTPLVTEQKEQLIRATALRHIQSLQAQIQGQLNQLRRDRAMPIIEEYKWIAAGTAFANPVPSLDLLATATITTQMVVDISALYTLNFSIDQGKKTATALAELMVKLGLVELATQALSPLLKGTLLTYAAGGVLQGFSAAYLTHVAGISLIEFFEDESAKPASEHAAPFSVEGLKRHLQRAFDRNQRADFLKALVQTGTARLLKSSGVAALGAAPAS